MLAGGQTVVRLREYRKPVRAERRMAPRRTRDATGFLGVCADGDSPSCMPAATFARDRLPDAASLS